MPFLDAPIVHTSTYHKNAEIHFLTNSQGALFVTIDTERLHIRSIESTEEDLARLASLFGDENVMDKFFTGQPITPDETRGWVDDWTTRWRENNPYSAFAIFSKDTKDFLGMAVMGLSDTPGVSQLSYLFHPRYWNKGYASETAAALVTEYAPATVQQGYALEGKPLERIVATARVDNPASFRILEKVGMLRRRHSGKIWRLCGITTHWM